ncbi:MAG: hypothetical protein QM767_29275 [Anaeromyxobacter sp.]
MQSRPSTQNGNGHANGHGQPWTGWISPPPAPSPGAAGAGLERWAEEAAAPHPVHLVAGDGRSPLFLESADPGTGRWQDAHLTDPAALDPGALAFLVARGLLILPGAPGGELRARLQGRLVVPRDLATRVGPIPVCFIVMGNHNAFDGTAEIQNFAGYDYLQQALADLGVASCSVDTNLCNAFDLPIRSRAEMVLATMELVGRTAPAAIRPRLDFTRCGLVGHSRGGEAVVMAALLAADRSLPVDVRCVASIAPTDFSSAFTGGAVGGRVPVPLRLDGARRYLVLHGAHDGDVANVRGNGFGLYDRATCPKTMIFARGLTHNRFNTVWNECADYADGRHVFVDDLTCRTRTGTFDERIFAAVVHREYASFYVGALVRRTLLGDASAEQVLVGVEAPTAARLRQSPGLQGPAASIQWTVGDRVTVQEFEGAGPFPATGGRVEAAATGRATVPHATQAYVATAAGNRIRVEVPSGRRNVVGRRELTFRLTSMIPVTSEAAIARAPLPDWEVRVITGSGTRVARARDADRRGLREPNRPFFHEVDGPLNVTKNAFDTVSIPLSAFGSTAWNDVQAIEFEARGGAFPLIVDSIAFV